MDDLAQAMGMNGICKSQLRPLRGGMDDEVKTFLCRPIKTGWAASMGQPT